MTASIAATVVFPSPSIHAAPSGSAITAAGPASSMTRPLTDALIGRIEARGLDVELMARLGVEASDRLAEGIAIPFVESGVVVARKHRTLGDDKRFTQDAGGRQILWNVDCLADDTLAAEPLIVTEGELDAIAAIQAGFPRTVSVPGGAPAEKNANRHYAFLDSVETQLLACREIILAVDDDGPGNNLLHDLAQRLGRHRCRWLRYPEGTKDLNDVLRLGGVEQVRATIAGAQPMKMEGVYRLSELPPVPQRPALTIGVAGLDPHYRIGAATSA
jgi:twinkle protein